MTQVINISIPVNFYHLTEKQVKDLDAFALKYKGVFEIQYSNSLIDKRVFTYSSIIAANKEFHDMCDDFIDSFPQFEMSNSHMKSRPSDLLNDPTNDQLAQDMQDKALASECKAQEKVLMEKYGITKQVTYTSKDHKFADSSIDKVIKQINKAESYEKLLKEVTNHLSAIKGDTDIRDVIEYVISNYNLDKRKE